MSKFTQKDCFAYRASYGDGREIKERCEALNEMQCKREGVVCPFYKRLGVEIDELRKYNNCTNVDQAVSEYTRRKEKEREKAANERGTAVQVRQDAGDTGG